MDDYPSTQVAEAVVSAARVCCPLLLLPRVRVEMSVGVVWFMSPSLTG